MRNTYKYESIRICRFLYTLGFEKQSMFDQNNKEYLLFERSQDLQKIFRLLFCYEKRN